MRNLIENIPDKEKILSESLFKRIDGVKLNENHEQVAQLFE